jgi:signal recognition particle GTPase
MMERISERKKSFFGKLAERLNDALYMHVEIDEDMMDEIEEILITSDIGMDTTIEIWAKEVADKPFLSAEDFEQGLKEIMGTNREL